MPHQKTDGIFMRVVINRIITGILSSLLLAGSLHASDMDAKNLANTLGQLKSMQGDFSQETFDAKGKVRQKQSGHFAVKNTGEFLWSINSPYVQVIASDGKQVQMYDPDLQQITYKKLDKNSQSVPLLLFSNNSNNIMGTYHITLAEDNHYLLVPKNKDSLFESMELVIKSSKPESLIIVDTLRQKISVTFHDVNVNKDMDAAFWKISIPDDTEIIDER